MSTDTCPLASFTLNVSSLFVIQDRKPLKENVDIPQSLVQQANATITALTEKGDMQTEEVQAEILKAADLNVMEMFRTYRSHRSIIVCSLSLSNFLRQTLLSPMGLPVFAN